MSRGIRIGNIVGYPIMKASGLTLSDITITPTTQSQTIIAPANTAYHEVFVEAVDATIDSNIKAENIKDNVEILGIKGTYGEYYIEKTRNTNGTLYRNGGISTAGIKDIVSDYGLAYGFYAYDGDTMDTTFYDLEKISGQYALYKAFGSHLGGNIYFPALKANAFGSYTNQFNSMLYGAISTIVHFPSNLEAVIGNWSDVVAKFDGNNTKVLFDLPATN